MFVLEYFKKSLLSIDYLMVVLICGLCVFGIIVIGSVTNIHINPNSSLHAQQQFAFVSGLIMFFVFSLINHKLLAKLYWPIYGFNLLLLVLTYFFGTGAANVNRGLMISFGGAQFGIQPSQYAKIFMILFLAGFIDKYKEKINNIFVLLGLAGLIAVPVYLIFQQPSLSASMVVLLISATMLFLGGLSYKYIFTALSAIIPAGALFYLDLSRGQGNFILIDRLISDFQIRRLLEFIGDPGFQTLQARTALGSGQLSGRGLYNGIINQMGILPEAHNDFIFAVIGEEFGFIGANIVLFVILILIIKCLLISHFADTLVGMLIAAGVCGMLFFQTFIHVGVVTNILPNTGITLPFVSYGGSSMWVLMISMGIVMNIHITNKQFSKEGYR
ncbi:MAG: FtsW/RodA/SpoVE family cell cycle protein [Defluviitaleaceae bacterium]|nr:FtsW/RodA/SpoVE family cell cycle protein [Defluviitaleaceae bacterium]